MELIDKSPLVGEIERWIRHYNNSAKEFGDEGYKDNVLMEQCKATACKHILSFINTLEVQEADLYNNGWVDCTKQMPTETKQTSDTLQGHREWTESDSVLVWDSMYGCSVDATKNGKWMSERRGGYTGQVVYGIIAWRPIPEFSEELLLKAQKGKDYDRRTEKTVH